MPFFAILTDLGLQRLAEAQMNENPLVFTHVAVGDGNGVPVTPLSSMTELVNEVDRVAVNGVSIAPEAPRTVRVEGLLEADDGGYTIREVGLFNGAGEIIAIAGCAAIYKPNLADGISVQAYLRVLIELAAVEAVALTIDQSVITATRLDLEDMTGGGLYLWETFQ